MTTNRMNLFDSSNEKAKIIIDKPIRDFNGLESEEPLNIFLVYKSVKEGNMTYKNYMKMFSNESEATEYCESKEGHFELINATEKDLEQAITEEGNTSNLNDIRYCLQVLTQKMYKIKSKQIHKFYDLYAKEICRLYLDQKSDSICKDFLSKLEGNPEHDVLYINSIGMDVDMIINCLKLRLDVK